jgi:hypothetical protein
MESSPGQPVISPSAGVMRERPASYDPDMQSCAWGGKSMRTVALCLPGLLSFLVAASTCGPLGPSRAWAGDNRGWLGIYTDPVAPLPEINAAAGGAGALQGATTGLRVTIVFPDSPAEHGGLLEGDIIIAVCGRTFTCPRESVQVVFKTDLDTRQAGSACPLRVIRDAIARDLHLNGEPAHPAAETHFWVNPSGLLDTLALGSVLDAHVEKRQAVLDLPVVLGLRPEARWSEPRANDEIYPAGLFRTSGFTPVVWKLADEFDIRADTDDLLWRLSRCHSGCDPYRLECMTYAHRDPFRLESVSRHITEVYAGSRSAFNLIARSSHLFVPGHVLTLPITHCLPPPPGRPLTSSADGEQRKLEALLNQITEVFAEADAWHRRAFAALTDEERAFLESERWNLSDAFAGEVYIHFDEDRERFRRNRRLVDLAARVDYGALMESAARLALLTDPTWARAAGGILRQAFGDSLDSEILLDRETPYGRFLIGGTSHHWYRDLDAALIIDLGGNDFYTGNNGGSNGWDLPLAVCIDLAGNDAYESTLKSCQGTGCLGIGGMLDVAGDDTYIGLQWSQGTGYFGIGWLHDLSGNDTYRGRSFCQAVGLFGMGFLLDEAGDDRYEGDSQMQGVGLPKGIGALIDRAGDDEYYAKGLYPTGYGDAGIFDAWSQGCGMGFRTIASGGLGVIVDGAGRDRMEAGNFSQGGGYYYGYGIVHARGKDNDLYIGSRYNQGFCAHQAIGVFFEEGGDDLYTTRQAVAQGLAWDECVTLFIDEAGNDTYEGGTGFSQGASAHNSFCFFFDRAGRDAYVYAPGQARAGGNNYHGGTSFSLFVDEGGQEDLYTTESAGNDFRRYKPEHGFFMDLAGRLEEKTAERPWEAVPGTP